LEKQPILPVVPSPLLQTAGHGVGRTVSRRTANKKLTKLYWPSRKRSPERSVVLVEPKNWRGNTQNLRVSPPTTFKFVPAPLPLSLSAIQLLRLHYFIFMGPMYCIILLVVI